MTWEKSKDIILHVYQFEPTSRFKSTEFKQIDVIYTSLYTNISTPKELLMSRFTNLSPITHIINAKVRALT